MLNRLFVTAFGLLLLTGISGTAQDFQGVATYETKTKLEIDLSGSNIPADRIQMIQERMKRQMERTYTLTFNRSESLYEQEEQLDQPAGPGGGGGGIRMVFAGGPAGAGKHYKNTQSKTSTRESEFSGKNFLIKDDLVTYEWQMEEGTKMIGQYTCFKATAVIQQPAPRTFSFGRGQRGNDAESESEEETEDETDEPEMVDVIVTAWYTLDIPVNHGPGDYWGLPGLILELNSGNTTVLCSKIVLNPKEKMEIKEPTKGKEVSQEEYDEIIQEKMKEMEERMGNPRRRGEHVRSIRIRG
jgi:GLPGLI family protein